VRRSLVLLVLIAVASVVQPANAMSGALDPAFSQDGIATAFAIGSVATAVAIDHAGRTVVAGYTVDAHVDVVVARFRPDGTFDPSFNGDGRLRMSLGASAALAFDVAVAGDNGLATVNFGKQETANAVSFAPSGAIDIGGYVSNGSTMRSALARLRPNGTLDPAFGGDGRQILDLSAGAEQVNDLVVMPSGDIVAAGYAEFGTVPRFAIFRVHGNGDVAIGFGHAGVTRTDLGPGADIANAIAVTGTGGFVLAGSAANGGHADWGIVRYAPNGQLDPTFGNAGVVILAWSAAPDRADGVVRVGAKVLVAGRIHRATTADDAAVVRLRADGSLDPTFATNGLARVDVAGGTDAAHGIARQPNGKIVAAGETWRRGVPRFLVFRLTA